MRRFAHFFVHLWGNWEDFDREVTVQEFGPVTRTYNETLQRRRCSQCGRLQTRAVA